MASNYLPFIQLLLDKGASINVFNNTGKSPLFFAFQKGHWHSAKWVIMHTDIDINQTSPRYKNTLLYNALDASQDHEDLNKITFIQWLVTNKNAAIDITNTRGETPLLKLCIHLY